MKKYILLFTVILWSYHSLKAQASQTLTVLFLGNSYTYYNNLPTLIDNLALSNNDDLVFDQNTPGGHTFNNHFNNTLSLSKINQQNWDYVILQAQSQEPSFSPAQVNAQTLPFAIKLDSAIQHNNACSQTVFFETWGRKFGDQSNCANYPPVCTYTGMQNRLRASYKLFADTTKGIMAPVGEAFRSVITASPNLNLYDTDNSHPSLAGSYLAACVFYESLFKKSCVNSTYFGGLPASTALFLQQIANATVNDSLLVWNIGRYEPYAPFTYTNTTANTVQFQSIANGPGLNHLWYFGDGNTSTVQNPSHTYTNVQNYIASHVVYNTCKRDSSTKSVSINSLGLGLLTANTNVFSLYPNPVSNYLYLNGISINSVVKIYSLQGQLLSQQKGVSIIDVKKLQAGTYILEITGTHSSIRKQFIKE